MAKLSDLATVFIGMTIRQRSEHLTESQWRLMQLGDLDTSGRISFDTMLAVAPEEGYERYIAQEGDVIFRGRGAGISAAVMPKHESQVVVVAHLIIMRPDPKRVLPEYLAWALLSRPSQRHYALHVQGTNITGVGKKDVETLEIDLPPLNIQQKVAELAALQKHEEEMLDLYKEKRRQLVDTLLHDIVAGAVSNFQSERNENNDRSS